MDATDVDFESKVIERSRERTVVVDFWAPWCGPCLALGPILERLAEEPDAAFELVKVNVDESPQAASAMGVRGIPYVVAFRGGEPVNAFTGALPESDVRRFLREVTGTLEEDRRERLAPLQDALERGDLERAAELIESLRMDPEVVSALDPFEARLHLSRYAANHAPTIHDGAEDDPAVVMSQGVHDALTGDHDAAFDAILGVLQRHPAHRDEARELLVSIIRLAVSEESARQMRRRLAAALY